MALPAVAAVVAAVLGLLLPRTKRGSCRDRIRARLVGVAAAELGKGTDPADVTRYVVDAIGHDPRGTAKMEWCGLFVLWALHQVGLGLGIKWKVGVGFLQHLPSTSDPKPGDIAYFDRSQHHAMVERVHDNGTFDALNGNGTGGVVTRSTNVPFARVRSFESIEPLLDEVCE